MRKDISLLSGLILAAGLNVGHAQSLDTVISNQKVSLNQCVQYALTHQPTVQQALVDERIAEADIRTRLSDWLPQVNGGFNYQHNFQLQQSAFGGTTTKVGVNNTSAVTFGLNQVLFNRDVFLANRTARDVRRQAQQNTQENKIDVAVTVSKAFYDVLLTAQQITLVDEDIARLDRSLRDATNQYKAGVVDKTDYKRAQILLNNSRAQKQQYAQQLGERQAYLKQQMGYPDSLGLELTYDSAQLESQILIDTSQHVIYDNRIEYQRLATQRRILESNVLYAKYSAIPNVGVFGGYNLNFLNNDFSKLYNNTYPQSFAGVTLAVPIFRGFRRTYEIRKANLQVTRLDLDLAALRNTINYQYKASLASYKSSLATYLSLKENLELARDVFNTIELQYRSGIKQYLDVIIAQTDLRSTQVNYLNALYNVLSSELDVQRALGNLKY